MRVVPRDDDDDDDDDDVVLLLSPPLSHHNQNENDSVDGAPPGVLLFTKQSKERSFRFWTTTRSTKTTHRITERRSHRT